MVWLVSIVFFLLNFFFCKTGGHPQSAFYHCDSSVGLTWPTCVQNTRHESRSAAHFTVVFHSRFIVEIPLSKNKQTIRQRQILKHKLPCYTEFYIYQTDRLHSTKFACNDYSTLPRKTLMPPIVSMRLTQKQKQINYKKHTHT